MNNIVKVALREFILDGSNPRELVSDALDELIAGNIVRVVDPNPIVSGMGEFREHRINNGRIDTIKLVRSRLGCGLMEALIIVKGIESHFDIG